MAISDTFVFKTKWKRAANCRTSKELHSHRDVSVPAPGVNPDVASPDSWEQTMKNHGVLIPISTEVFSMAVNFKFGEMRPVLTV